MSDRNINESNINQQHIKQQYAQQQAEIMNYKLSPEEERVLKECKTESFYYRCMPFSLSFGATVYWAVKNGYLKPSVSYGPWPKVIAFGLFGFVAGRVSYMGECKKKIMALPNSRLAELLHRRDAERSGNNWNDAQVGLQTALSLAPFKSVPESSYADDYNQPNSLNLDTSRPYYSGLDDVFQPKMEGTNDLNEELAIPTRKNTVTYDELRQKNRDEYARTHVQSSSTYRRSPEYDNQGSAPPVAPSQGPLSPPAGAYSQTLDSDRRRISRARIEDDVVNQQTGPKNKYGDTWSE